MHLSSACVSAALVWTTQLKQSNLFGFVAHIQKQRVELISVNQAVMIAVQRVECSMKLCCLILSGKALLDSGIYSQTN